MNTSEEAVTLKSGPEIIATVKDCHKVWQTFDG
jgi:hypothetical protein